MTLPAVTPPQHPAEARRAIIDRQLAVQDDVTKLSYYLTYTSAGEATVDVNFPVRFIDRPACSDGGELGPGNVLVAGSYPTVSVVAGKWKTEVRAGHTYYIGATLVVVITGPARTSATAHFHAEGKAIVGPVT